MALTSGLSSLNVHEALAFDGAEICLHPDLFSPGIESVGSTIHSINSSNKEPRNLKSTPTPTLSQDESLAPTPPPPPEVIPLKAGDLVEICVWDLRSSEGDQTQRSTSRLYQNNLSSILRKRVNNAHSPLVASSSMKQTTGSAVSVQSSNSGSGKATTTTSADNTTEPQIEGASKAPKSSKKQDGIPSEVSSSEGQSSSVGKAALPTTAEGIAGLAPSMSSPKNAGGMPPVFPRSVKPISVPGDGGTPQWTLSQPQPPSQLPPPVKPSRTRRTSEGTPLKSGAKGPPTATIAAASPGNLKPARHVREISDMTMDTTAYAAIAESRGAPVSPRPPVIGLSTSSTDDDMPSVSNLHFHSGSGDTSDDGLVYSGGFEGEEEDESVWPRLAATHRMRLSFVMQVTDKSLTPLKGSARTRVSILRRVADLYDLSSYDMVTVSRVEDQDKGHVTADHSADYVVMTIKEQFISRGDMHFFQETIAGTWIYEGQRLHESRRDLDAQVLEIMHDGEPARSGFISDSTNITFRSRSARIVWLIQMSTEMWDYASPYEHKGRQGESETRCELYFDKLITFLRRLFNKWKELETTHSLTAVFFSRTFVGTGVGSDVSTRGDDGSVQAYDVYGRKYEDHFRIIAENEVTASDWDALVVRFREAFVRYPKEVGWNDRTDETSRKPSSASQGNVLEAINVALNLLQYHYLGT